MGGRIRPSFGLLASTGARLLPLLIATITFSACVTSSTTAVGCVSGLSLSAPNAIRGEAVRSAQICFLGSCTTARASRLSKDKIIASKHVSTASIRHLRALRVNVALRGPHGASLLKAAGSVQFHKEVPNGTGTSPVCFYANVTMSPNGHLAAT